MTWVRLEDQFDEHPKIAALSDTALALFVCGLGYCNRNLTDGFIPTAVGNGKLRYCDGNPVPAIRELVAAGLWEQVGGGWLVHDFLDYQPSKEKVLEDRAKKQAAGRAGGQASARARRQAPAQAKSKPVPVPVPVPQEQDQEQPAAPVTNVTAEALLAPDSRAQYFLLKLIERDERWKKIGPSSVMKLSKDYPSSIIIEALSYIYEQPDTAESPYPYLLTICRRIEERETA